MLSLYPLKEASSAANVQKLPWGEEGRVVIYVLAQKVGGLGTGDNTERFLVRQGFACQKRLCFPDGIEVNLASRFEEV